MQTISEDQLVGHRLGKYRVERFIGRGRLNSVYLVRHQVLQRVDAFTLYLVPEHFSAEARALFLDRFRKEAAAITTLDHPNILPVYEYGELSGYPYLITPYTMYGSLADIIKQQGRCEHTFVSLLLTQIIDGLGYAHQHGCVHGTLKPSNIVIRNDEALQVAGFGLMRMLQRSGVMPNAQPYGHMLSIADTFLAAPEYMAPEFVRGNAVDARSDVYAVGCILFELLSGQPPFTGSDPLQVAQQRVQQDVPLLRNLVSSIPIALASVVHQALERDPARRFQSIRELGDAFAQASQGAARSTQAVAAPLPSTGELPRGKQDAPRKGFASERWQLVPPIVTEHLPSINPAQLSSSQKGAAEAPRFVPAPPTLPPPVAASFTQQASEQQQAPARVEMQQQAAPQAGMQQVSEPIQQQPGMLQASGQMQAQEIQNSVAAWWSLDDNPLQPAPEARPAAQPEAKVSPAREPAAARNETAGQVVSDLDWMAEPVRPRQTTKTVPARSGRRRSQSEPKVKRRSVIALLATGGVVAAGAAVAINLGHFGSVGTKNQTKAPTTVPAKAQMKTQSNTQATAGHTGNVIGSKTQAVNSAVAFTDSANNTAGLLVHLPQGEFVAYERACTHVGVLVNYDPATHMFVCPAHGAIFDPANGGAVIQGPAQLPLPKIGVQVNGDGTVTMV